MQLIISPAGIVQCVYGEDLELASIGQVQIRRASHVEPNAAGQWWADLSPVGGPKLGPHPCRSEALAAEAEWLVQHMASAHG